MQPSFLDMTGASLDDNRVGLRDPARTSRLPPSLNLSRINETFTPTWDSLRQGSSRRNELSRADPLPHEREAE